MSVKEDACKRNLELIERYKAFYASDRGGLMTRVSVSAAGADVPAQMVVRDIDWEDEASCRAFARSRLERAKAFWQSIPDVDDDEMRRLQNLAGTGAVAAAFVKDAVLTHEETTNYLVPPIRDWNEDTARIGFDPDNPWYRGQMAMLREYVEGWDGSYGIVPFTHFDPLDLCNQWRGNELFLDYYDHPEELGSLLDKATECVLELESHTRSHFMDGYDFDGAFMGCWTPGTYLSCDAGDMGNPETLAKWGVPYTQRIVQAWGGGYLHHHELGIHQIPTWSACEGLTIQFLNRDPNTDHLANVITEEHLESSFQVAIGFIATYEEFQKHADRWAQGKCVVAVRCDDTAQAQDVVKRTAALRNF